MQLLPLFLALSFGEVMVVTFYVKDKRCDLVLKSRKLLFDLLVVLRFDIYHKGIVVCSQDILGTLNTCFQ